MARRVDDTVLDGAFEVLDNGNLMIACSAEPLTRAEAVTTYALADVALVPVTDFVKANGDVSGRKCTIAAKPSVNIDANGTANHVAVVDGATLLYVTTCTPQALTAGNTLNFPAWKVEIADPTA